MPRSITSTLHTLAIWKSSSTLDYLDFAFLPWLCWLASVWCIVACTFTSLSPTCICVNPKVITSSSSSLFIQIIFNATLSYHTSTWRSFVHMSHNKVIMYPQCLHHNVEQDALTFCNSCTYSHMLCCPILFYPWEQKISYHIFKMNLIKLDNSTWIVIK